MQNIAKTGMREVLLLTGESRSVSGPEYIAEAVRIAEKVLLHHRAGSLPHERR